LSEGGENIPKRSNDDGGLGSRARKEEGRMAQINLLRREAALKKKMSSYLGVPIWYCRKKRTNN